MRCQHFDGYLCNKKHRVVSESACIKCKSYLAPNLRIVETICNKDILAATCPRCLTRVTSEDGRQRDQLMWHNDCYRQQFRE